MYVEVHVMKLDLVRSFAEKVIHDILILVQKCKYRVYLCSFDMFLCESHEIAFSGLLQTSCEYFDWCVKSIL